MERISKKKMIHYSICSILSYVKHRGIIHLRANGENIIRIKVHLGLLVFRRILIRLIGLLQIIHQRKEIISRQKIMRALEG